MDKLATTTKAFVVSVGQPAFFIGADGRVGVGGMPSTAKPSGNTGQLEVKGNTYTTGNAYAGGKLLMTLDKVYPVGSIFISATHSTASAVATALGGGTWEAWGAGRVPVGVNSSDTDFNAPSKTGGSKTVTLTESQLPKHRHPIDNNQSGGDYNMTSQYELYVANNNATLRKNHWSRFTGLAGGGEAHPNMPPYITVYMWKRTA